MARIDPTLTDRDLQEMARRFFNRTLAEAEVERLRRPLEPATGHRPSEVEFQLDHYSEMIEHLENWLDHNRLSDANEAVADILSAEGIELAGGSDSRVKLAHYALRAKIEILKIIRARTYGDFDARPTDSLFLEGSRNGAIASSDGSENKETVGSLITKYLEERQAAWQPRTKEKFVANLAVCAAILGADMPARALDRAAVRRVKETINSLPAHWQTLYRGKSPQEAAAEASKKEQAPMSAGTVNAYLGAFSAFVKWAHREGFILTDAASKIAVPDPVKPQDKRHPFELKHLQAMFNAPLYRGMKSEHRWKVPGTTIIKNTLFWVPLVALFTGMRLGEILALKAEHFTGTDDIDTIRVVDAKTKAGIRIIPVHPRLLACGLIPYVRSFKTGEDVFPGYTQKAYSKFFRRFQDSLGIENPKLVFHSFRHNFADALRAARTDEPITKALLGHSDGTVTGIYGNGYSIEVLKEALDRIDYKTLDLTHLAQEQSCSDKRGFEKAIERLRFDIKSLIDASN